MLPIILCVNKAAGASDALEEQKQTTHKLDFALDIFCM